MDLLFSKYASPFLLIDTLILTNSLSEYISDMYRFTNEEKQEQSKWEFFLHKVYEESWTDFNERLKSEEHGKTVNISDTLAKNQQIMANFIPDDEEGV